MVKKGLWIMMLALVGFVACTQIDGECYPRGEGPGSGQGGGVIVPGGPGGFGDVPPPEPQGTGDPPGCNIDGPDQTSTIDEPDQTTTDAMDQTSTDESVEAPGALKVFCKKPDWGVTCSERCLAKNVPCVPFAYHPYKKATGGTGQLWACNTLFFGFMCSYHYDNGDDCHIAFSSPSPTLCSYSGGE